MSSVGVAFTYDAERLQLMGVSADGTGFDGIYEEALYFKIVTPGEAYAGVETHSIPTPLRVDPVPPGEDIILAQLRFRIRAAAAAGQAAVTPVARVDRLDSQIAFDEGHGLTSETPDTEGGAGQVTVSEPSGPRPISDLTCRQFLDRAELTFSCTEAYDAIELRRDGALIATLAANATSASASINSGDVLGAVEFSLTALVGDAASVAVVCKIDTTTPTAPRVEDFGCENGSLSWSQAITYDSIELYRDDEQLATLAGDAGGFSDPQASGAQTVYTIVGVLEGFESPLIHCIDNGVWAIEADDVHSLPRHRSPGSSRPAGSLAGSHRRGHPLRRLTLNAASHPLARARTW